MKFALVIPTFNAAAAADWQNILQAYAGQCCQPGLKLIIDSGSGDSTIAEALAAGWQVRRIAQADFDHGATRNLAVRDLDDAGFEAVVFATQDVLPADPHTLKRLLDSLAGNRAAAAYARQIPAAAGGFDRFCRLRNYPEQSLVKCKESIPRLGLLAPFCSNSLAVWDLKKMRSSGGFPETAFGEDMLLAARLLLAGEKIVYCAESCCFHDHSNSFAEIWKRGVAIGRMHKKNPFLRKEFGSMESGAVQKISFSDMLRFAVPLGVKYAAFLYGLYG